MSHMEQAYGFTPTHTEQYISPTCHKCKKYIFQAQASTRTKILAEIITNTFYVCNVHFFCQKIILKYSDMQLSQ